MIAGAIMSGTGDGNHVLEIILPEHRAAFRILPKMLFKENPETWHLR